MATVLDVGILQSVDVIFPFIFSWAVVFALLHKTEVIGKNIAINSVISAVVGFTVLLSQTVIDIINFMIPWFTVALIFFVLLLLVFQTMGLKDADLGNVVKDKAVYWTLIGVGIIIIMAAFGNVLGQTVLEAGEGTEVSPAVSEDTGVATSDFQTNIINTLRHPKVLGIIVIFGIAIFAVALLSFG